MKQTKDRKILIIVCGLICMGAILLYVMQNGGGKSDDLKIYIEEMIAKDRPEIRKASNQLEYLHIVREWVFSKQCWPGQKIIMETGRPKTRRNLVQDPIMMPCIRHGKRKGIIRVSSSELRYGRV